LERVCAVFSGQFFIDPASPLPVCRLFSVTPVLYPGYTLSRSKKMAVASAQPAKVPPPPDILPTLFGTETGEYRVRKDTFVLSFLLHTLGLVLLGTSSLYLTAHREEIKQQVAIVFSGKEASFALPFARKQSGGGGGGGDRDKLQAPKGSAPKFAREQITPPAMVIRNPEPKLTAEPTVIGPPQIVLPQLGQLGDPLARVTGPASSGTGSGSGIGSGSGGGVGSGRGPGVGPGYGGGIGGGAYRVGGGVTAPRALFTPDPEYSDEARKAKFQGTVILWVVIGADGLVHEARIARSVGMGLDEKALTAVRTWRFEPSRKDGQAVPVQVNVEVSFHLY
jgi:TonB family protein